MLTSSASLSAQQLSRQLTIGTLIASDLRVIRSPVGNMLVLTGTDGPLVVGPPEPELIVRARRLLSALRTPRPKYALIIASDSAVRRRDGGWGRAGALAMMQEGARLRMRFTAPDTTLPADIPTIGFSDVLQLSVDSEEIHIVHQPAGFSDTDVSVHFEVRHVMYLGNLFTTDGYPSIDVLRGGTIGGLIQASSKILDMFSPHPEVIKVIVPGRGPLANLPELRAYRDMLLRTRERVDSLLKVTGDNIPKVVAAHPTRDYDARWGHGAVTPDRFVEMVGASLAADRKRNTANQ